MRSTQRFPGIERALHEGYEILIERDGRESCVTIQREDDFYAVVSGATVYAALRLASSSYLNRTIKQQANLQRGSLDELVSSGLRAKAWWDGAEVLMHVFDISGEILLVAIGQNFARAYAHLDSRVSYASRNLMVFTSPVGDC